MAMKEHVPTTSYQLRSLNETFYYYRKTVGDWYTIKYSQLANPDVCSDWPPYAVLAFGAGAALCPEDVIQI